MSYNSRRILTPASRKRKAMVMEATHVPTSSKPLVSPPPAVSFTSQATTSYKGAEPHPLASNRLLAGYMAHEFLTKGTLFGQRFEIEPARAEALPLSAAAPQRGRLSQPSDQEVEPKPKPKPKPKPESYVEVANLLKCDGVHIPGVVNPTQLARWINKR